MAEKPCVSVEGHVIQRLELKIYRDPYELSPNSRLHWQARRRKVSEWRILTRFTLAKSLQDGTEAPWHVQWGDTLRVAMLPPYIVQYAVTRKRAVDLDNISPGNYALKAIVDELVAQGVLVDDAAKYLRYEPSILTVDRTLNPFVVVTIIGKDPSACNAEVVGAKASTPIPAIGADSKSP